MTIMPYIKDPTAIYALSFARVRAAASLGRFPDDIAQLVIRVIHACGMPDLADDIVFTPDVAASASAALAAGAPILADCGMVASGITKRFLHAKTNIVMTLYDDGIKERAAGMGNTRSAAAVEDWHDYIGGGVVAIGNAPTALFHLLDKIDMGWPKPAAILAFPVGFVGAAESKAALAGRNDLNFITLGGSRGGSAMASAAVNASALLSASHQGGA
ncbi:MAG: precorrin-8X methylmutase [Candidatus Puniceispirillales bacterium WSBS_2018_MAG_OTU23]